MPEFDVTTVGGFNLPAASKTGYSQVSQNIPYFPGPTRIDSIPAFQREYNLRDALVMRIKEGRDNMSKMLLADARRNGAYVVNDVHHRWPVDINQHGRFYLAVQSIAAGQVTTIQLANTDDSGRLQAGDIVALMGSYVTKSRTVAPVYVKSATALLPELMKITAVNYTTGVVTVIRNFAPEAATQVAAGALAIVASGATTGQANAADCFMIKIGNAMAEGKDDQKIWTRKTTFDYNVCQYVLRKWGATDIEQNVAKVYGTDSLNTLQKNKMDALEAFYDELEWLALFGTRGEGSSADNRWIGTAGGILEIIPTEHYELHMAPDYASATKMGMFTVKKFNKQYENKFFYGSQTKVLLCGQNYHTAFSMMINNQTQAVPVVLNSWGVEGYSFKTSSGGTIIVVPSDKLSLNGMSDYAILVDMEYFRYGHLKNMDINVIPKLNSENPHEETGEVFGVITFYRGNPYAHWLFCLTPNTES